MKTQDVQDSIVDKNDAMSEWFDKFTFDLHVEKTKHQTGTLNEEMKKFYEELMVGEGEIMAEYSKKSANDYFRKIITLEFLKRLSIGGACKINKLAIHYSLNSVLVWSVIDDNDEEAENYLILLQAKINAKYQDKGYRVSNTIIEKSDNATVPSHYREVELVTI